ncbi:MAG: AbrB/MazE/SpoVT family DNA-binding domain-containing protein [Rhodospirillaceae bacterium]|nr:AbrB/MazE/SpoVT family DNA-binding domain-containing protein [Rhodospirillaceae bacterium]MYK57263.1 AbrB/MazE/SpoVT family DNA-binding domain-containing protein [Rhodospirillaceae bacterium]
MQVTLPRWLAVRYGIRPGDDIRFEADGAFIRIVLPNAVPAGDLDVEARLRLFDAATERQRAREAARPRPGAAGRGWTRDELYDRGRPDAD